MWMKFYLKIAGGSVVIFFKRCFVAIIFGVFVSLISWSVTAVASLKIEQAWSLALPPVSKNGAAYLDIVNHGEKDRLLGASAEIADEVQIHIIETIDGQMKMQHLHSVEISKHGSLHFQPGAMHLMLLGLKQPLEAGKEYPLILEFEEAGLVEVNVTIQSHQPEISEKHHSSHGNTE